MPPLLQAMPAPLWVVVLAVQFVGIAMGVPDGPPVARQHVNNLPVDRQHINNLPVDRQHVINLPVTRKPVVDHQYFGHSIIAAPENSIYSTGCFPFYQTTSTNHIYPTTSSVYTSTSYRTLYSCLNTKPEIIAFPQRYTCPTVTGHVTQVCHRNTLSPGTTCNLSTFPRAFPTST